MQTSWKPPTEGPLRQDGYPIRYTRCIQKDTTYWQELAAAVLRCSKLVDLPPREPFEVAYSPSAAVGAKPSNTF